MNFWRNPKERISRGTIHIHNKNINNDYKDDDDSNNTTNWYDNATLLGWNPKARVLPYSTTTTMFSHAWHYVFRPSQLVQDMIPPMKAYSAVHIRVRHPSFFTTSSKKEFGHLKGLERKEGGGHHKLSKAMDVIGVVFNDVAKALFVPPAIQAVQCMKHLQQKQQKQPIFFFSDSQELIDYMVQMSNSSTTENNIANRSSSSFLIDQTTRDALQNTTILSRDTSLPSMHLDSPLIYNENVSVTIRDYATIFVDLYIASRADCMSYGLGRFGYLAARIGNISPTCMSRHTLYGMDTIKQWNMYEASLIPLCPIPANEKRREKQKRMRKKK
eukprot:CAMPEP_0194141630 /NCGR_PEP_ID=MMETSP0152-20130528/11029_1 /TAXON_ID=1049557 /ORGANISM="Thalassiothrix antarctica, Strain L6-D1" /LENGTH=328 /DNA_ID=CAMNT_0038840319 /DNA_START=166 /DNA_END=1149 /DNA_ORIENTATION=+